jgi:DivIVA domain-containing protein
MSDTPELHPDDVARRSFGTAFRGFDQLEVRAYLEEVAAELTATRERERTLRQALAEADGRSSAAGDELDAALGIETGKVLQAARHAAAEIRTRAEEQVGRLLREATEEAARLRADADTVLARRTAEAEAEAESIRAEAARTGAAAAELAQFRAKEMVAEAQEVRERVLKDLSRRRRHAQAQLDQLRAGRERLLAAYAVVRTTLDEATAELTVAEADPESADVAAPPGAAAADAHIEELVAAITARAEYVPELGLLTTGGPEPSEAEAGHDGEAARPGAPVPAPAVGESAAAPAPPAGPAEPAAPGEPAPASEERVRPVPTPKPAAGVAPAGEVSERRSRRRRGEPAAASARAARPQGSEPVVPPDDIEGVRILSPEEAARLAPSGPTARAARTTTGRSARRLSAPGPARRGEPVVDAVESDDVGVAPAPTAGPGPVAAVAEPDADGAGTGAVVAEAGHGPAGTGAEEDAGSGTGVRDGAEVGTGGEAVAEDSPVAVPEPDPGRADAAAGDPPAAATPEPDDRSEGDAGVDELFARIRARREESLADAEAVLAAAVPAVHDVDEEPPRVGNAGSEEVFEGRDRLVEPIERALVKRLKRSLADEQNGVLDALRRAMGAPDVADLLPEREEHVARHAAVAVPALREAAEAAVEGAGPVADVSDLAEGLARRIADDVRDRLRQAVEAAPDDAEALVESISASYREWKTARVAPLATQHVVEAYGRARFAAAPDGPLRWLVDGSGGCGPDCEDNALAGGTPKGEPFPTGHLHPPAHPSCRCLLVRDDA